MANENKFRVWCKTKKEWEKHTCVLKQDGKLYQYFKQQLIPVREETHEVSWFIGLRDDQGNGQEIYQGDICKITQGCGEVGIGEVVWDERSLCWALDIGYDLWHFSEIIDSENLVERIGNVWDNPELLKVAANG